MSNRIDTCFRELRSRERTALIPFMTAGDPGADWTPAVMHALVQAGADLIELGVPFSDPMADGPVIQEASERAIERGVTLRSVLDMVRLFRRKDDRTPVVLMGYLNPVERYGYRAFVDDAAAAGVDGLLMVDCPPEESHDLEQTLRDAGLHAIFLVAPTTTSERLAEIAGRASGYLYYVSFKGITGADRLDFSGMAQPISDLREVTDLPLAVGFGIKDAEAAAAVAGMADGVVIGSALVASMADASSADEAARRAGDFLAPVRAAMDNGAA
ncbi:tryptophan synthase subunit alpha [Elongatibacter sediminis]|uniref:Tryptophan synthase alpha chain n=1 Tax=Elongatibacter sediminis TaxID=3119006 RepID=A0AAW9RD18_9GAMM